MIIGIIIGLFVGSISGYFFFKFNIESKIKDIKRKGIVLKGYTNAAYGEKFNIEWEVEELERTKNKTKVRVLSGTSNTSFGIQRIEDCKKYVHNAWIDTDEIEWVEDSLEKKRLDKIAEALK